MQGKEVARFTIALALAAAACSAESEPQKAGPSVSVGTGGTFSIGGAGTGALPGIGTAGKASTPPPTVGGFTAGQPGIVPPAPAAAGTGAAIPPTPPAGKGPVVPPTPPAGVGGTGAAVPPAGGMPPAGGDTPAAPAAGEPTIPAVKGDCPNFRNGTISFMGLGGISMVAGAKAAGPTAPMVFYWHGTGSTAGEYAGMAAAISSGVSSEGGVLISFQGTTGGDALSGTATFGKGDFELADQLLACAVKNHNVDPKRVFSTGCSAGGLFANAMAASRSTYMAAVAPNSGGLTFPGAFQNMWTPALMTVHGRAGVDVVIIDFSTSSATADKAFKGRGGFVINCDHGGGHCGGGGLAGDMWKFFKAHPYGTKPSPWASALPSGFNSKCKIY